MQEIEIWADSFHEGVWCCDNVCKFLSKLGYKYSCKYVNGFIPCYDIAKPRCENIRLVVYGSYKSWNPIPKKIKSLIEWGKPDFVAYVARNDNILFAVEETAATPTGNQAMQRCERQYGSARLRIPYWYLVSEFGEHVDGGIRRDNIWPSIAAIKLSVIKQTPSIVLHYSDIDNIEDYNSGKGLNLLFSSLATIIRNYNVGRDEFYGMNALIAQQYKEMIRFICSQWKNVIDFLPSINLLQEEETSNTIADYALGFIRHSNESLREKILVWPTTNDVPSEVLRKQQGRALIKYDKLADLAERDITSNKCYILANNAGSGKPTTADKINEWIVAQKSLFDPNIKLTPPAKFAMRITDFPQTDNGNLHMTTSKNIVYLYDHWSDLKKAIEQAFPRLKNRLNKISDEKPVFLYIVNSLKPGRLFGDPYTGQLSAYATCFGKFDIKSRAVVAYFPHQVYTQTFKKSSIIGNVGSLKGIVVENKGTTLYKELTDYLIFNAGVAVSLKDGEVI